MITYRRKVYNKTHTYIYAYEWVGVYYSGKWAGLFYVRLRVYMYECAEAAEAFCRE